MKRMPSRISSAARSLLLLSAFSLLGWPARAHAALGDDASAVAADQARLKASLRITTRKGYVIHELTSEDGPTVREYVGTTGKVFAVSWSGGRRPSLRDILGSSRYDQFIASRQGQRRARGPVRVELPGMVITMGSYLRTSWGHVYLTDLAPAGWPEQGEGGAP